MGVEGQLHGLAYSSPRKTPPVPIDYEAGWALEPVCALREENVCQSYRESSFDSSTVHPIAYSLHRLRCSGCACSVKLILLVEDINFYTVVKQANLTVPADK